MTNQAKFKLLADAFSRKFFIYDRNSYRPTRCNRNPIECASCTLNGSNYGEPGICLGRKILNDTTTTSRFFDQYPEYLI